MEHPLKNPALAVYLNASPGGRWNEAENSAFLAHLGQGPSRPVAIVDIGSNSVRLVAYESLSRAPTPIFNEKAMCGLGSGIADTGFLKTEAIEKALAALKRFRVLLDIMQIKDVEVFATAAARDAINGPAFLQGAAEAIGHKVELLSGAREAYLSALGVTSGFYKPDGIVGDMGGGSLELIEIGQEGPGQGLTLPLGGLALLDSSKGSLKLASKIIRDHLLNIDLLQKLRGRSFYAVGGTWRSLIKLYMAQQNYPLRVMHGYAIAANAVADFAAMVEGLPVDAPEITQAVSSARRPVLVYGALVLDEIIRLAQPKEIAISALGVREGRLYERLPLEIKMQDPLLVAAWQLNVLRSRMPQYALELCQWTDQLFSSADYLETEEERRLRHAACLLGDIGWRAHPDYRGVQSLNIIAHTAFSGIDHAGRAFLALTTAYRHNGKDEDVSTDIRQLLSPRLLDRSRILGTALRAAYVLSAAMPDILPRTSLLAKRTNLTLIIPASLRNLASDRVSSRFKQLGKQMQRTIRIKIVDNDIV